MDKMNAGCFSHMVWYHSLPVSLSFCHTSHLSGLLTVQDNFNCGLFVLAFPQAEKPLPQDLEELTPSCYSWCNLNGLSIQRDYYNNLIYSIPPLNTNQSFSTFFFILFIMFRTYIMYPVTFCLSAYCLSSLSKM